ncbi:NAD(P)H nitroreductase [soil metagenome]
MNAHFPTDETVGAALSLAARAPSVHNSQPWRWRVGDESLHLYAVPGLQLHRTDPDGRDLMLSCGTALNHCSLALAALGWQSKIHRFPNPDDPHHLAAISLRPLRPSEADIALAAAIPRRRTDRRLFSSWPVPRGDIALMGARAARAGTLLRQIEATESLNAVVAKSVRQHATDDAYARELAEWSGRYASTAGVPARNTPPSDPAATPPGRLFAGTALAQPVDVSAGTDRGVLLALGTAADLDIDRLRAGEATSTVLLTATALGLASCPITEPLEIAETRNELAADVFGATAFPQMLLRIGWGSLNADPLPATPRRPLSETVDWLHRW